MSDWHHSEREDVLQRLQSSAEQGLSAGQVVKARKRYGPNELVERGMKSPWKIFWEQLTATLVVVLIVAAAISLMLGDLKDAIAILAIVILNALLGFRQEYRAERAMAALKRLTVPRVKTRRDGHVREISAQELVPGDVILLEAGSAVPADGRLLEDANLQIQEAALTGESQAVFKDADELCAADSAIGDRHNLIYMGTSVINGRGVAVITATGMETELGKIATMIQTVQSGPTPLQRRLDRFARMLAAVALVLVALIFVLGLLQDHPPKEMFLTAVSLAVAAIPEGLPAVVTIALAIGAQRIVARNALIRKLPAVETLGSVTTICSDKTGTLTRNEMTVTVLDVAGDRTEWRDSSGADDASLSERPEYALLLAGGALCNDAVLEPDETQPGKKIAVGDPTETALVVAADRCGLDKRQLEQALPRVGEAPFDSDRKRMSTVHRIVPGEPPLASLRVLWDETSAGRGDADCVQFTKGALDSLLEVCSDVLDGDQRQPIDEPWRTRIRTAHDELAADGVRVLGVAFRMARSPEKGEVDVDWEQGLTFVGLFGLIDPPRTEAGDAIRTCREAGIRPVMITGDHPLTAKKIASQLGIDSEDGVLTGRQLDELTEDALRDEVQRTSVYARVSPAHKLRLVKALQDQGHVVAMTGDGVNDAPALKQADIGVAMGITGTDVAKEAADAVLQDDNFATIVAAIKEGRVVYDNIRKFIMYTMASNTGEVSVMLMAPLLAMDMPLLPLQILWINLVTDGLPGLALAFEPGERNTMRRGPYPPRESIFARGMGWSILWIGLLMGIVSFLPGFFYERGGASLAYWRTIVFTVLTLSQMGNALAIRSSRDSLFRIGLFSNKALLGSVLLTLGLQLVLIYVPPFQKIFETEALLLPDLLICLGVSTLVFWAVEAMKWAGRIRERESSGVAQSGEASD